MAGSGEWEDSEPAAWALPHQRVIELVRLHELHLRVPVLLQSLYGKSEAVNALFGEPEAVSASNPPFHA